MVTIEEGIQIESISALQSIVKALERRFPNHNGPFEYCTRMAEETGELVEVTLEVMTDTIEDEKQKAHLIKEQQDVLRVILGIIGIYDLGKSFPQSFEELHKGAVAKDLNDALLQLTISVGELASAVNHAEGMGVKADKHGDGAQEKVLERAKLVAQLVVWMIRHFNVENDLENQIAASYRDYKNQGFITE